jgi:hypothetical protein
MTERGLPIVDGAPACPFVAFEDDRDERASSPDHRHRCYAELSPAPRALAHQEAYCLASAFPVCPTFQDWARREAARARASSSAIAARPSSSDDQPRNPPRDWSAPPPWAGGAGGDADAPDFLSGRSRPERGLAGSAADRLAGGGDEPAGAQPRDRGARIEREEEPEEVELVPPMPARPSQPVSPPAAAAGGGAAAAPAVSSASAGADGSAAARRRPAPPPVEEDADEDWDDEDEWEEEPAPRSRRDRSHAAVAASGGLDRRPRVGETRPRREREVAPSWERPRRYEAYPTLKTRVGLSMPSFGAPPRLMVIFLALVVAAIALFFLPALLGIGRDDDGGIGGPGASPTPSAGASVAPPSPTPVPQPTPQIYIVQSGDTMSRIANRFGVSLADLIEANRENLPDPDTLDVGDEVIIPAPPPEEIPGGSPDPSLVVP